MLALNSPAIFNPPPLKNYLTIEFHRLWDFPLPLPKSPFNLFLYLKFKSDNLYVIIWVNWGWLLKYLFSTSLTTNNRKSM